MRIGTNPQRDKLVDSSLYIHQVIMPVYIPNIQEYYKDSFEVFKLSIQSLIKTSHKQTYITVVANGCCIDVEAYIKSLYQSRQIHEVVFTGAIGKVNAILKGLAGALYPLVTITDADVLFLNNWQQASYNVFNHFPKCGVVCPVPNPRATFYKNGNIIFNNLFTKSLKYTKIKNVEALKKFAESIGELKFYEKCFIDKYLQISNKNFNAVVGAGHFIATYKTSIFDTDFIRKTDYLLGGNSEGLLDHKAADLGLWRLTTTDNYAYHMGNTMQNWFQPVFNGLEQQQNYTIDFNNLKVKKISNFKKILFTLINKAFDHKKIRNLMLNIAIVNNNNKKV